MSGLPTSHINLYAFDQPADQLMDIWMWTDPEVQKYLSTEHVAVPSTPGSSTSFDEPNGSVPQDATFREFGVDILIDGPIPSAPRRRKTQLSLLTGTRREFYCNHDDQTRCQRPRWIPFLKFSTYLEHMDSVAGRSRYFCPYCDRGFLRTNNLKRHLSVCPRLSPRQPEIPSAARPPKRRRVRAATYASSSACL